MERPKGVTVLAYLGFLSSLLSAMLGIISFVIAFTVDRPPGQEVWALINVILGFMLLFFAVLILLTSYGLWKLKNWARGMAIFLTGIEAVAIMPYVGFMLAKFLKVVGAAEFLEVRPEINDLVKISLFLIYMVVTGWILTYLMRRKIKEAFAAKTITAQDK